MVYIVNYGRFKLRYKEDKSALTQLRGAFRLAFTNTSVGGRNEMCNN